MAGTDLELSSRNRSFLRRQQSLERPGVAHRPLVASARPLDLTNKTEARRLRVLRQGWQQDAAAYVDNLPELSFAYRFLSNASSRMRYFPALVNPDEPDGPPIAARDVPGVPAGLVDEMNKALAALGVGRQAISPIQKSLSYQFGVPGECYLTGMNEPVDGEETWKIRSVDEFQIYDDTYKLREVPLDPQGVAGWIDLDPNTTYACRMWVPHWRFSMMATSPMRSLLDVAEELLLLGRDVRATARSRLAGSGIMKFPEGLRLESMTEDNLDPEGESVFGRFAAAMMSPLADEGVASAVVPIVISGEPESLAQLDHLVIDRPYSAMAIELRAEAIGRLATGLDVPREVLEGMSDPNHWGAWLVSDDTFRHHVEPQVITQVDAMTVGFLRTWLMAAGWPKFWVDRACIWYNPVDLISKPDPMANAVLLHDRYAISNKALRLAGGFAESDAPGPLEVEFRMLQHTRTFPPNMVEAIFHEVDPDLEFPPIKTSGTIPGIGPEGEVPGDPDPAPPTPVAPGAPAPPPPTPVGGETAPTSPPTMTMPGASVFQAEIRDGYLRQSRKLTEIDADLRARLQTAACAAMTRALERTGAKLRSRVSDKKYRGADTRKGIDTAGALFMIEDVPNRLVASVLGEALVASLGFAAETVPGADWSELRDQFTEWTRAAQGQALKVAAAMGKLGTDHDAYVTAQTRMREALLPAWQYLEEQLGEIAHRLLFTPDGDKVETVSFDPNTVVPVGVIRSALTIAGGGQPKAKAPITADAGPEDEGDGEGNAVDVSSPTDVPTDSDPANAYVTLAEGGIGNGEAVGDLLTEAGAEVATYEWIHGPTMRPFEPHEALDGVQFSAFDDDALANDGDFPENDYYFPGDHDGCSCDFSTVWGPGDGTVNTEADADNLSETATVLTPADEDALVNATGSSYLSDAVREFLQGSAEDAGAADLAAARDELMDEVRENGEDASSILERLGSRIQPPQGTTGGEYDWYRQLTPSEQDRLRNNGYTVAKDNATLKTPDEIQTAYIELTGHTDASVGDAMAYWVQQTRMVDGARLLETTSKLPGNLDRFGSFNWNDLAPSSRMDVPQLFNTQGKAEALNYLNGANREAAYTLAEREMAASRGLPIYQMSYTDWEAELTRVSEAMDRLPEVNPNDEWGQVLTSEQQALIDRSAELLPEAITDGLPDDTPLYDVWLEAQYIAKIAGLAG